MAQERDLSPDRASWNSVADNGQQPIHNRDCRNPFAEPWAMFRNDEADIEPERGGLDAGDGAPLAVPDLALCRVSVAYRALCADGVSRLVDLLEQRPRAGQSENVIDAFSFTPRHRLGPRVVAVAPKRDARLGTTPANAPDEAAQMGAHLDPGRRLAGPQHNGDGTASFGVVDMDRQKQPRHNGL